MMSFYAVALLFLFTVTKQTRLEEDEFLAQSPDLNRINYLQVKLELRDSLLIISAWPPKTSSWIWSKHYNNLFSLFYMRIETFHH